MEIRKAAPGDIPRILTIYDRARSFMRSTGNLTQWINGYPSRELVESDIKKGSSYVCLDDGRIVGAFYFAVEIEKTYLEIEGGSWLNEDKYAVVHRIAVDSDRRGIAPYCLAWSYGKWNNVRIDTHRDNKPMQRVLEKCGFSYCGVIHLEDGAERIAFQKAPGRREGAE
jgi:RimJ/RimL family protein N-acetyltransferase